MLTVRINSATSVTVKDWPQRNNVSDRWEGEFKETEFTGRTAGKQAAAFVRDAIRTEVESLGVKA